MFKSRRQRRYNILLRKGFLKAEAYHLSKIPSTEINQAPWFRAMIRARLEMADHYSRTKRTYKDYSADIMKGHRGAERTRKVGGVEKLTYIGFRKWVEVMKRSWERTYPGYESPSLKKGKRRWAKGYIE